MSLISIPGFGERGPGREDRQGILDLWAEMFSAVESVAIAAEASQPGVTTEPLHAPKIKRPVETSQNVLSLDQYRAERAEKDLGRGTIVAATDSEQRRQAAYQKEVSDALDKVYRIHDNPGDLSHAA